MGRLLRKFLRGNAGTTAIEFAMIAVPFFGLIGGIFETGMVYFRTAQLQSVTETASRILLTHNATAGQTNQQFINSNICTWKSNGGVVKPGTLSTMFDCDKVMIQVTRSSGAWSTFDTQGSDIYANNGANYNSGAVLTIPGNNEVAIVRVVYPMPVLAGILGGSAIGGFKKSSSGVVSYNSNLVHMLVGMAAFRVEPA